MPTTRDLIDLAIEYEMVKSTADFYARSTKAQAAILKVIAAIAATLTF